MSSAVSGTINNFISRVGAGLPQFAVNPSTSRFVSVYSKAVAGLLLFQLMDMAYDSFKVGASKAQSKEEEKGLFKDKIFQISERIVLLAALYFKPYVGSLLFFGNSFRLNLKPIGLNLLPSFPRDRAIFSKRCSAISNLTGLTYLFIPASFRFTNHIVLAAHIATAILHRVIYSKMFIQDMRLEDCRFCGNSAYENTNRNWFKLVYVPVAIDLACVGVGMRILLNK